MKKSSLLLIVMFVLVFSAFAMNKDAVEEEKIGKKFAKSSMYMTGQIGTNSYVATDEPFSSLPFPLGVSYEVALTDNIGIGGTVMFDKWSDYLGMFGGKWTFRVFKPSFDVTYHFYANKMKGLNLFAGASLGYSLLSVSNDLGNDYDGELESEPHLAPFLGLHLYFWENHPGFFKNLMVTSKVYWSLTGDFSGITGAVGITYKIK
jgi:opacity protein-like surface antigen